MSEFALVVTTTLQVEVCKGEQTTDRPRTALLVSGPPALGLAGLDCHGLP